MLKKSMKFFSALYASEMESQLEEINEVRKDEQLVLPDNLDYMRYNISCCVSKSLGTFLPNSII